MGNTKMPRDVFYEQSNPIYSAEQKLDLWETAKGLQATDGLQTSDFLDEIISEVVQGKYDTNDAYKKIQEHYADVSLTSDPSRTVEADKVTANIVSIIERNSFALRPTFLQGIHRVLFQDFKEYRPGEYRTHDTYKRQNILAGDSVSYGPSFEIADALSYDFTQESKKVYGPDWSTEQIDGLVDFVSGIWQIHPYREGNTRTISTFLISYLRSMGVTVNNEPFKLHADWFRNTLVRANYTNIRDSIKPDKTHLRLFIEAILFDREIVAGDVSALYVPVKIPNHQFSSASSRDYFFAHISTFPDPLS
jgi:fido (protein-threonine AMPylation protein)